MNQTFEKYFRYIIGVHQIIGGLIGLFLASNIDFDQFLSHLFLYLIIIGLFVFSIYCGLDLLINKTRGYKLTLINQYPQLAKIILLGYGYEYYTGLIFIVGFTDTPKFNMFAEIEAAFRSQAYIFMNSRSDEISIIINIIPIIIISIIFRLEKKKIIKIN
jgi:hypothetical protein